MKSGRVRAGVYECGCIWHRLGILAQLVVLAVQFLDAVMNFVQSIDVGVHFVLGDFGQVLFLEQPLQFFLERDEFGVLLVEIAGQGFAGPAQGVFQLVGQHQLFFADFGELEDHLFQRHVQQIGGIVALLDGLFEIEQVKVVAGFPVQQIELLKIQLFQKGVFALQADQIVQAPGVGQRLFQRQHGFPVLYLR